MPDRIVLAHGSGGKWTQRLIEEIFLPAFSNPALDARLDGAVLEARGRQFAFTTDSFVVRPLFFPGGNIGDLAVHGTVNDLAMCGARPAWLSAGFILEEGLPLDTLRDIVASMRAAAGRAGVHVVAGDTKVVDKGKGDGVYITTSGIGFIETEALIAPLGVEAGDAILVSGDLGRHGIAVLSAREGLGLEGLLPSDSAPVWEPVEALLGAGIDVHCLRDLTRGGLASALNEIAAARGAGMVVDEALIPVHETVRGACELLGLDPLYVANEGRFLAIVAAEDADRAAGVLRSVSVSRNAVRCGWVTSAPAGVVLLRSRIGGHRVLDMLSGDQLPRIC